MATGERILAVAARDIGYHEGKNKHTKYGEWTGYDGQPWCMSAVEYWYHEAGCDLPYLTASCGALLRWYRNNQSECVTDKPEPGCIVIFDFPGGATTDHTGLFVKLDGDKIVTIDGNTGNESEGNGGWVQQKSRKLTYANPTYIVPRELKDGSDMKRFDTVAEIRAAAPWAVPTVEKLVNKGALTGTTGWYDEDGMPTGLDLSEDMLRVFVVMDRAGAIPAE